MEETLLNHEVLIHQAQVPPPSSGKRLLIVFFAVIGLLVIPSFLFFPRVLPINKEKPINNKPNDSRAKVGFKKQIESSTRKLEDVDLGDLWVMNEDGSEKRQVTFTENIEDIYDWSPDGKYIVVIQREKGRLERGMKKILVVVEVNSGEIIPFKEIETPTNNIFWLSQDDLAYYFGDKLEKFSLKDKKTQVVLMLPSDLALPYLNSGAAPHFSHDMRWATISLWGSNVLTDRKGIASYNTLTKEVIQLTDKEAYLPMWSGDKIIYHFENNLWQVKPDGSEREKLIDIGDLYLLMVVPSADGGKILYARLVDNIHKLFLYDFTTRNVKEIYTFEKNTSPAYLSISEKGDHGRFSIAKGEFPPYPLYIFDFSTGGMTKICDDCQNMKWFH